jgi:hypothetical protein
MTIGAAIASTLLVPLRSSFPLPLPCIPFDDADDDVDRDVT